MGLGIDLKEMLKRIRVNDAKINTLIKQKDDLEEKLYLSLRGRGYKEMLEKVRAIEEEIDQAIDEYVAYKDRAMGLILGLENDLYIKILTKRYFEYKTFETIAEEVYVSVRHTTRLHGYALKELEKRMRSEKQYDYLFDMYIDEHEDLGD